MVCVDNVVGYWGGAATRFILLCATAICLVALGASLPPFAQAQYKSGPDVMSANFWIPKCRSFPESSAFGECGSFIIGLSSVTGMATNLGATWPFCIPEGVTYQQMLNIVVLYADRHPQMTHLQFGAFIVAALTDAFPCR
jgi:Ssp1 endopeptidase immunity protein Rap1a